MKANYEKCLAEVLKHEGGWSSHPKDPGGDTMKGVTQGTYDDWRKAQGLRHQSVRLITDAELQAIYRNKYWNKVRGDDLPGGVDLAVFDFAVNSGVSRSVRYLQRLLGVVDDGVSGPKTLQAIAGYKSDLAADLCDRRLAFLQSLATWPTFGKGWAARVASVKKVARELQKAPPQELLSDFEEKVLNALENPVVRARVRELLK